MLEVLTNIFIFCSVLCGPTPLLTILTISQSLLVPARPSIRSSYYSEGPMHVEFCARRD